MIKIGIELDDSRFSNINISNPENGNPGIGGSEYLFAALGRYLSLIDKEFYIVFFHYNQNQLPAKAKTIMIKDDIELIYSAKKNNVDVLIHQVSKSKHWYHKLSEEKVYSIAWAHIFLTYDELKSLRSCDYVKRVVFVGKEQYDTYIDDDIIMKSTYIYNMIDTERSHLIRKDFNKEVTYVGSLVPAKGFYYLAKIWPQVIEEHPEARLNVIGTGKVYNRKSKLGKYGLAEEEYEKSFMEFLTDDTGKIIPSVNFMGILGEEKENVFSRTAIGVVNPSALTETFCMSAVEMEICGVPIISKRKWGLLDTIKHKKTGLLFYTEKQFLKQVNYLLWDKNKNNELGYNAREFVTNKFSANIIVNRWIEVIKDVVNEKSVDYDNVKSNFSNDFKWIRVLIRIIRFNLKIKSLPSLVELKFKVKELIKKD